MVAGIGYGPAVPVGRAGEVCQGEEEPHRVRTVRGGLPGAEQRRAGEEVPAEVQRGKQVQVVSEGGMSAGGGDDRLRSEGHRSSVEGL